MITVIITDTHTFEPNRAAELSSDATLVPKGVTSAQPPAPVSTLPASWQRLIRMIAATIAAIGLTLGLANSASAAAYTESVYAPNNDSGNAEGWATVVEDCTGTLGCWNYMKIEKWGWFGNSWVGGNWVTGSGWQSVSAALPSGCGYYRTTVDSYNDSIGPIGGSVTIDKVSVGADGQKVYRYKTSWSSSWSYLCH